MSRSNPSATYALITPMPIAIALIMSTRGAVVKSPRCDRSTLCLATARPSPPARRALVEEHHCLSTTDFHRCNQGPERSGEDRAVPHGQPLDPVNQPSLDRV